LLCSIPAQRRSWRTMLGAIAILVALTSGMLACGGSGGRACPLVIVAGTTPGTYTATVTGTSGALTEAGTVTLTVQ
jgi:hypothetical protein